MATNSEKISSIIGEKIKTQSNTLDFAKKQIAVLDSAKEPYKSAITKIDGLLFAEIDEVNQTIIDVQGAYQDRIDAGCRSDLFWSLIEYTPGISPAPDTLVYRCESISYVGYGTTALLPTPAIGAGITPGVEIPDSYGYDKENFHGIKQYIEPYAEDLLSTYVGSSIGTVGAASTVLYLMSPILSGGIGQLEVGQVVTSSKSLVFSGGSNTIVGIGTIVTDISRIDPVGITTTETLINVVTLKNSTINSASAPEDDGSYVTFTIGKNPDSITDNLALSPGASPYVNQTVRMMSQETIGAGTSIKYDNSGKPNVSREWNQFLNGLQDPDDLRPGKKLKEPSVGAGTAFYRVGFTSAPAVYSAGSFDHFAAAGEIITTSIVFGGVGCPIQYENLSSCPSEETALTNKIAISSVSQAQFTSGISTFNAKVDLANLIRQDMNDLNVRIWGYRLQMQNSESEVSKYNNILENINDSEYLDLIN